jgi:hypothetical protein
MMLMMMCAPLKELPNLLRSHCSVADADLIYNTLQIGLPGLQAGVMFKRKESF